MEKFMPSSRISHKVPTMHHFHSLSHIFFKVRSLCLRTKMCRFSEDRCLPVSMHLNMWKKTVLPLFMKMFLGCDYLLSSSPYAVVVYLRFILKLSLAKRKIHALLVIQNKNVTGFTDTSFNNNACNGCVMLMHSYPLSYTITSPVLLW